MEESGNDKFADFVLVDGRVVEETQTEGVRRPVEGVLIKTSTGTFTYTDKEGSFKCPVCPAEDYFAICAIKSGYQVWVDWWPIDPEECRSGLEIPLQLGPEGTAVQILKQIQFPACCTGKVIDSVTKKPIYHAAVSIDGAPPKYTNKSGVYSCVCAPGVDHVLCVSAQNYQRRCFSVKLVPLQMITLPPIELVP
jgi:hypothetical protein